MLRKEVVRSKSYYGRGNPGPTIWQAVSKAIRPFRNLNDIRRMKMNTTLEGVTECSIANP
jgi:hypothetical protein